MSEKSERFQQDIMSKITQTVIDGIKGGTAPWQKPWDTRNNNSYPTNLATGNQYHGLNAIYLDMLGSASGCDYWVGAKQGIALGGKPQKDTKVYILRPMMVKSRDKKNADGSPVVFCAGFAVCGVHNARTGFTGLEDKIPQPDPDPEPRVLDAPMLDEFMATRGADIRYGGDHAFYNPGNDFVQLPDRDQFRTPAGFYGTVLHELTHWTGHTSRLNRKAEKNKRGYAFEELIAELGCYYASVRLDCPNEAENHTSYLDSWISALQNDVKYLWDAASRAEKAANWLIDEAHKEAEKAAQKQAA